MNRLSWLFWGIVLDSEGALRARHEFAFCGVMFLTLHCEISCRGK